MKIWLYTFTHNEEKTLPFWLSYYLPWVDKIIVYDNESTDATASIVKQYGPQVELREFYTGHHPEPEPLTTMRNTVWKEARGRADWVLLMDSDEYLYYPMSVPVYLAKASQAGFNAVKAYGWEMISVDFPKLGQSMLSVAHSGVQMVDYSKPTIFQPTIKEMNFTGGCLSASIDGPGKMLFSAGLSILHCKRISFDYYMDRVRIGQQRVRQQLMPTFFPHLHRPDHILEAEFYSMLENAVRVVL